MVLAQKTQNQSGTLPPLPPPLNYQINGNLVPQLLRPLLMGRNRFQRMNLLPFQITVLHRHRYCFSCHVPTLIQMPAQKEPSHSATSPLLYHSTTTSPLLPTQRPNQRPRPNQNSIQALVPMSSFSLTPNSTMSILFSAQTQIQIQRQKTET